MPLSIARRCLSSSEFPVLSHRISQHCANSAGHRIAGSGRCLLPGLSVLSHVLLRQLKKGFCLFVLFLVYMGCLLFLMFFSFLVKIGQ